MSSYSAEQILDKFRELHERLGGADRPVSIAKVTRAVVLDPLSGFNPDNVDSKPSYFYTEITPAPIVTLPNTPDLDMWQYSGGAAGADEKMFVFLADSLVDRDPIETLGERAEAFLRTISGVARGAIKYGDRLYTVKAFYPTNALINVVPQWTVVAKAAAK